MDTITVMDVRGNAGSNGHSVTRRLSAVATLSEELAVCFPERREAVRAMLTAAVAGEHTVMLGPPGTAKSLLARTMAGAFRSTFFELLMTRFSTPEEVLGPVTLSGLQADRFTRAHEGYLPTCQVAFLDEIFKANSAILNALLTALNERVVHDDGKPKAIPLVSCVAASNELPEDDGLEALYDRFLVRVCVDYIADRDAFRKMLTAPAPSVAGQVDIMAEQAAARAVTVTDDTINALVELRYACRAAGIVVSDRRWRQCLSLVKAAGHIDGRTATDTEDLEILEHVLWRKPDERVNVARTIQASVSPSAARAVEELDAARDLVKKLPEASQDAGATLKALGGAIRDLGDILKRIEALPAGKKVATAKREVTKLSEDVKRRAMAAAGIKM